MLEHLLKLARGAGVSLAQAKEHLKEAKKLAARKCQKPHGPKFYALVLEHLNKALPPKPKEEPKINVEPEAESKRRAKNAEKLEQSAPSA